MGGRGSSGGNNPGGSKATTAASPAPKRETKQAEKSEVTKNRASSTRNSVELNTERNMPQMAVTGIKSNGYSLEGKLDMSKSYIQKGDSFGIRILGMRNYDVYGTVSKVTKSSIIVNYKGSNYTIPTNKVEINGRELRFKPKDKNSNTFGFVDLRQSYSADDFKKRR